MLRRRELVRVHAGVYVDHTGPLTVAQLQWVAVLACWPAALSHQTVIESSVEGPVHVAVAHHRKISAPDGVVVHRMADFDERVRWNASPPSVRFEHAVIDVAVSQARRGGDLPGHRGRRPVPADHRRQAPRGGQRPLPRARSCRAPRAARRPRGGSLLGARTWVSRTGAKARVANGQLRGDSPTAGEARGGLALPGRPLRGVRRCGRARRPCVPRQCRRSRPRRGPGPGPRGDGRRRQRPAHLRPGLPRRMRHDPEGRRLLQRRGWEGRPSSCRAVP